MQVESFGDGLIWAAIALIQVVVIVYVIRTGDPADEAHEADSPQRTGAESAPVA